MIDVELLNLNHEDSRGFNLVENMDKEVPELEVADETTSELAKLDVLLEVESFVGVSLNESLLSDEGFSVFEGLELSEV